MNEAKFLKQIRQNASDGLAEETENLLMRVCNCNRTDAKRTIKSLKATAKSKKDEGIGNMKL